MDKLATILEPLKVQDVGHGQNDPICNTNSSNHSTHTYKMNIMETQAHTNDKNLNIDQVYMIIIITYDPSSTSSFRYVVLNMDTMS